MHKKAKILGGLVWLLVSFNVSAFFLSLALTTPVKGSFSWRPDEPFSYFINSRYFPAFPWLSLSALALSVGVYTFVKVYLDQQKFD